MARTIAGIPVGMAALALAAGGGALWWIKKNQSKSASATPAAVGSAKNAQPTFTQAQEIQDFQIYSQLTQSQQASDLSFVGQMLSLFGGGGSNGTATTGSTPSGGTGGTGGTTTGGTGGTTGGTTTSPGAASTNPNLQTTTINGQQYYVLGGVQNGKYSGYNVNTGAPVYATQTGNGTPTQGFTIHNLAPGEVLYTPTSTPTSQIGGYVSTSASF